MEGRWCSAAEVAADVSRAGGGFAPPAPLADACLAWGARPAPLILTEPELQPEEAPQAAAARAPSAPSAAAAPDLRGITRMLRMVQTDDTDEDSSATGDIVITKPGRPTAPPHRPPRDAPSTDLNANDVTADNVINSDLNPHVAEFVPRRSPHAPGSPRDCGAGGGGREELAARLREEIGGGGGRDKCSAIARLMRLYAQPAGVPRLLTPDYFERPAPAPAAEGDCAAAAGGDASRTTERIPAVGSHCISPMMSERQREAEPQRGAEPPDVRASLDKVRRWLGDRDRDAESELVPAAPPARASPRLLLAPVTFRSRVPSSPAARTPPPPPAPAAPSPAARAYSPPHSAAALHREYAARAAAAQAAPPPVARAADTLWTRLEARLRQKDAELRARAAPAPAPDPAPDP